MEIPKFPNGRLDWETLIRDYARENDMSFSLAMRWCSNRRSLQVAAELMGIDVIGRHDTEPNERIGARTMLNQLGAFLNHKGYSVPRLFEIGHESFDRSEIVEHNQPTEEVIEMRNDITKEQYLELRLSGLGRSHAQRKLGVNPATFYAFLTQWGIKDKAVEDKLLEEMRILNQAAKRVSAEIAVSVIRDTNTSSAQNAQVGVDKAEQHAIQRDVCITVTLTQQVIKESLKVLIEDAYETACKKGWHESPGILPVQLALIHSEVSEALEADRKEHGSEKVAEELADIIIRTFDTAASHNLDLAGALFRKMTKNREREHRHGGLKY